ncbi:ester cyclase [Nakamurella sp.]|uniref:ester cyclase n=1 Tax=Nakamurella sp. TaxID=1869182 RepID=UPI003784C808
MLVSVEENRALVWQAYDTTFNRHDPEAARSCYAAGYVGHMPHHPQPVGRDGLIAESNEILAALPDVTVTFDDAFGTDDRLVVRHSFVGTHTGPLMGIPPTGRLLTFSGTDVYRIVDGEIVEEWSQPDLFGVLNQLGVIPAPAP